MMKQKFDFDKIGKATPYRTPEGFFDAMQEQIIRKAADDKRKRFRMRTVVVTVLAAAAIVAGVIFVPAWHSALSDRNPSAATIVPAESTFTRQEQEQTAMAHSAGSAAQESTNVARPTRPQYDTPSDDAGDDWVEQLSDEDLSALNDLACNDDFLN